MDDGLIEQVGWRHAGTGPGVAEVRAKQPIEFLFVVGVEVVSVPPEPITAFRRVQFFPGGAACSGGRVGVMATRRVRVC